MNEALTTLVQSEYDLDVAGLRPLAGGHIHEVWRADSNRGPIVLKHYANIEPGQLRTSLELQQCSHEAGIPVPAVIPNRLGHLATKTGRGYVTAQSFIAGEHRGSAAFTPALAESAGRTLALVHRVLAAASPTGAPPGAPSVPSADKVRRDSETWLKELSRVPDPDEWDRMAIAEAEYRLRALSSHAIETDRYHVDVAQWTHGDFYPGNLLFDVRDQVVAILDWDFAGCRYRGGEIARAAFEVARTDGPQLDGGLFRAFLSAYARETPLSVDQRALMFHQLFHHQLSVLYPLSLRRLPGALLPTGWQALARRRYHVVREIEQNLDLMTEWALDY